MNETDTDTKNTKPSAKAPAKTDSALARIGRLESLPVAMLKLHEGNPVDIPGLGGKSSVNCVTVEKVFDDKGKRVLSSACHVADFYPQLRHFRVTYYSHNAGDPPTVRMVHETHVRTWEPLG